MGTTSVSVTFDVTEDGFLDDARCDGAVAYDDGEAVEVPAAGDVEDLAGPEGCFTVRVGGRLFHVTVEEIPQGD